MRWTQLPFAAALMLAAVPASAKEPLVLPASTPWNLDYSEEACTLTRGFGKGDDQFFLRLIQHTPGEAHIVELISNRIGSRKLTQNVSFTLVAGGNHTFTGGALAGTLTDGRRALTLSIGFGLPTDAPWDKRRPLNAAEKAAVQAISIGLEGVGRQLVLQTGPMGRVFDGMRDCTNRLMAHWGFPLSKPGSRPALPKGNSAAWLGRSDYPSESVARGASAFIHFRLTVDPGGRVSKCTNLKATRSPEFIERTCNLLTKRARFEPALDADGKPTAGLYVNVVRWMAAEF